ncbi:spore germination lipoprotein GerD [Paenibacillus sp. 481]|uniref:spore germination lipoprotein GerD n=1 Tax=Paenibacillus sp. 481 TaxID=2835869 RepID=UPI001E4D1274|nr:spore germination lipoprotein GerD [Paenibacillus sp. 481]UHA71740.1 spore gernimation protein [Paenibacillus sp. 481]
MKIKAVRLATMCIVMITMVLSSACTPEQQQQSSSGPEYKELKAMVIDILKTDEAQKAIQSSSGSSGGGMQAQSLNMQQQEQIRLAVKDTLISPDYQKTIEKVMTEPKFAGEFAKSVSKQNKQIQKDLIKDPTYQQDVADLLKSPDMMKAYTDMIKTPDYRKQIMAVVKDSMQSPLFRLEVMDMLGKVVKEELQPKSDKGGGGKGGEKKGGGQEQGQEESGDQGDSGEKQEQ